MLEIYRGTFADAVTVLCGVCWISIAGRRLRRKRDRLARLLISNRPATFLVRVKDTSMIEAHLFDGDLAIVDRSLTPQGGDVVVVDVDGERSFKVWRRHHDGPPLSFANAALPAFTLAAEVTVEVWAWCPAQSRRTAGAACEPSLCAVEFFIHG